MTPFASLSRRNRVDEIMDRPGLDPAAHDRALLGLARINKVSRSADLLWPTVEALAKEKRGRAVKILDVATGAGDVPVGLWVRGKRAGVPLTIEACDVSPTALEHARNRAGRYKAPIRFFEQDVIRNDLPEKYDLVTCSLFLHHLGEEDAVTVLGRMREAAGRMVLVNDLSRSRSGFMMAWVGTRVLSRSPVVHYDGPASVRSAFTAEEAKGLAERAGMHGAKVMHRWPARYLLTWAR